DEQGAVAHLDGAEADVDLDALAHLAGGIDQLDDDGVADRLLGRPAADLGERQIELEAMAPEAEAVDVVGHGAADGFDDRLDDRLDDRTIFEIDGDLLRGCEEGG